MMFVRHTEGTRDRDRPVMHQIIDKGFLIFPGKQRQLLGFVFLFGLYRSALVQMKRVKADILMFGRFCLIAVRNQWFLGDCLWFEVTSPQPIASCRSIGYCSVFAQRGTFDNRSIDYINVLLNEIYITLNPAQSSPEMGDLE